MSAGSSISGTIQATLADAVQKLSALYTWARNGPGPVDALGTPTHQQTDLGSAAHSWRRVYATELVLGGFVVTGSDLADISGALVLVGPAADDATLPITTLAVRPLIGDAATSVTMLLSAPGGGGGGGGGGTRASVGTSPSARSPGFSGLGGGSGGQGVSPTPTLKTFALAPAQAVNVIIARPGTGGAGGAAGVDQASAGSKGGDGGALVVTVGSTRDTHAGGRGGEGGEGADGPRVEVVSGSPSQERGGTDTRVYGAVGRAGGGFQSGGTAVVRPTADLDHTTRPQNWGAYVLGDASPEDGRGGAAIQLHPWGTGGAGGNGGASNGAAGAAGAAGAHGAPGYAVVLAWS